MHLPDGAPWVRGLHPPQIAPHQRDARRVGAGLAAARIALAPLTRHEPKSLYSVWPVSCQSTRSARAADLPSTRSEQTARLIIQLFVMVPVSTKVHVRSWSSPPTPRRTGSGPVGRVRCLPESGGRSLPRCSIHAGVSHPRCGMSMDRRALQGKDHPEILSVFKKSNARDKA